MTALQFYEGYGKVQDLATPALIASGVGSATPFTVGVGWIASAILSAIAAQKQRAAIREAEKRADLVRLRMAPGLVGIFGKNLGGVEHLLPRPLAQAVTGQTFRPGAADFVAITPNQESVVSALETRLFGTRVCLGPLAGRAQARFYPRGSASCPARFTEVYE